MDTLLPEMRDLITPKLKGKLHERQRNWMLVHHKFLIHWHESIFFCLLFYFTTEYDMCFRALQYSCGCSPKAFLKKPGCITVASVSFFGQISDAVYGLVQSQTQAQYEAVVQSCEAGCPPLETTIRTDMDQIITSKEHVTSKIRGNFNWKCVPSFKSDTGVK